MTRILGIDPGSIITGYGIIDIDGNHARHVSHGSIRINSETLPEKLRHIFNQITWLAGEFHPEEMAIEKVFMHKNADSALKLGQARGTAITACALQDIKVFEYTPNQVKQATVGRGHAEKQQVQHMIKVLLCLDRAPQADAADALAIALCHAHTRAFMSRLPKAGGTSRKRRR
ncbi:MAG: crossover junction endodeoxyribonuclease RuvC [Gammaproteobacteria bacterium]